MNKTPNFIAILLMSALPVVADSELQEIENQCMSTSDIPHRVSRSCMDKLSVYFSGMPVWQFATMSYPMPGKIRMHGSMFNNRAYSLPFSLSDKGPVWSDVFDGSVNDRSDVVASVFMDPVCGQLRHQGAIRPNLSERCEARDLFLYAAQIDACMTGIDRYMFLTDPIMVDGQSRYDIVSDPVIRQHYLYSIWMIGSCSSVPGIVFNEDLSWTITSVEESADHHDVASLMRTGYDAAMRIAARAGDPWAIGAIDILPLHDIEYLQSLYNTNVLLFHRWLGTSAGKYMAGGRDAQIRHALRAYVLELHARPDLDRDEYLQRFGIVEDEHTIQSALEDVAHEGTLMFPWELHR